MKKQAYFQKKKFRMTLFYIFASLFCNLCLSRRQLDYHIFILLPYMWFHKKTQPHADTKLEKSILIAFSDNYGYSSLILLSSSTSSTFLKVSKKVESETISTYFLHLLHIKIHWFLAL